MSEEMVRVLIDSENDVYETVPITQVPPGYILVRIKDRGEFYINPSLLSGAKEYQHPPFPEHVCAELQKQHEAVVRAGWDKSLDEWIDGFRYDRTTWREMAYWEFVVEALKRFTSHLPGDDGLSVSKRKDVFAVLTSTADDLPRVQAQMQKGGKFRPIGSLTTKRINEIVTWLLSEEADAIREGARNKYRELLRERIAEVLPNRTTIAALLNHDGTGMNHDAEFNVIEFIATADIIMGEDITTPSKRFIVHGKERYEQLVTNNTVDGMVNVAGVRLVWVEIDIDTDEYDQLIALVTAIKGPDDYELVLPDDKPRA